MDKHRGTPVPGRITFALCTPLAVLAGGVLTAAAASAYNFTIMGLGMLVWFQSSLLAPAGFMVAIQARRRSTAEHRTLIWCALLGNLAAMAQLIPIAILAGR
jgi:hypothetical protein